MVKLNHRTIMRLPNGRHGDGGGLCLNVGNGGRSWVYRFRWQGRRHEIGLGSAADVSLSAARELARDYYVMLKRGIDPRAARKPTNVPTFGECAKRYVEAHRAEWTNRKHAREWGEGFARLCPSLLNMPVEAIDTETILAVLKPMWATKRETANRLRGRTELVLSAAKAWGYRSGENPAMWRGHLDHLLARASKGEKEHLPAMPYQQLPAFMARLRERSSIASRALEFAILTGARADEVVSATWDQFDLQTGLWTVPASEMKGRREHRVPLVGRALDIVKQMAAIGSCDWVFPGRFLGRPLGHNALYETLTKRMGVEYCQHGFRSTFRDWAGDCTTFPKEIAEQAIAHKTGSDVELAYRRGDALERRRELMTAWDQFCRAGQDNVVAIAGRKRPSTSTL
jgi:integrase